MEFCAELMNVTPAANVIPGFASHSEFGMYAIASVEESYNTIMQEIGIIELASVMEADGQPTEGKSIKTLIKKFVDWAVAVWKKFTAFLAKCRNYVLTFVGEKILSLSGILKKVKAADLKKAIEDSTDDKWNGLKNVLYYDKKGTTIDGKIIDASNEIVSKCIEAVNKAEAINDLTAFEAELYKPLTKLLNLSVADVKSADALKTAVKGKILTESKFDTGKQAKKYALDHIDDIYTVYQNKTNTIKEFDNSVKKPYNELKKSLDRTIKTSKKAENGKELKPLFVAAKTASKISTTVVNAVMDAVITSTTYDLRILTRSIALTKVKVQKESAVDYSTSTFQSELSSLFNF